VDLTDRMIEHDLWLTRQLLDAAATLPEEQLDQRFDVAPGCRTTSTENGPACATCSSADPLEGDVDRGHRRPGGTD
jgi:hypothetical protein